MLPTLINTLAVLIGSAIGLLLHGKLAPRFKSILFQAIGLATIVIGLKDALKTQEIPLLAFGMIVGGLVGEGLNIEARLQAFGGVLKRWLKHEGDSQFVDAYVFSSILFCMGALTVVGTFRAGVEGNGDLIYTKSLLDGHASIFLAGAMGAGVMASSLTILLFQGGLTLFFMAIGSGLPTYMITETASAGGLLIVAISINMLELGKIRLGNLFPGMFFTPLFVWIKYSFFV